RSKIRHFIQGEERTRSIELGRRLFEKEVRRFDVPKTQVDDAALTKVAVEFGSVKADDVYAAIGYGKSTARAVLSRIVGPDALQEKSTGGLTSVVKRAFGAGGEQKIKVSGIDDL